MNSKSNLRKYIFNKLMENYGRQLRITGEPGSGFEEMFHDYLIDGLNSISVMQPDNYADVSKKLNAIVSNIEKTPEFKIAMHHYLTQQSSDTDEVSRMISDYIYSSPKIVNEDNFLEYFLGEYYGNNHETLEDINEIVYDFNFNNIFTESGKDKFIVYAIEHEIAEPFEAFRTFIFKLMKVLEENDDLFPIYRAIDYGYNNNDLASVLNVIKKHGKVGRFWSYNQDGAKVYCSNHIKGHCTTVILHAMVHPSDVHWDNTVYKSVYALKDEMEIELGYHSTVKITAVQIPNYTEDGKDSFIELERPLWVKA